MTTYIHSFRITRAARVPECFIVITQYMLKGIKLPQGVVTHCIEKRRMYCSSVKWIGGTSQTCLCLMFCLVQNVID